MADKPIPVDPVDAYKRIIDDCVDTAKDVTAERIRAGLPCAPNPSDAPEDLLVNSLSAKRRMTLAQMLDEARSGGVHDLLASLSWWIEAQGLRLTYRGKPVPVDFSGMGLHGDYVGRLALEDQWQWPKEPPPPLPHWAP